MIKLVANYFIRTTADVTTIITFTYVFNLCFLQIHIGLNNTLPLGTWFISCVNLNTIIAY